MSYESWRISYQSSEPAARSAYDEIETLRARIAELEKEADQTTENLRVVRGAISRAIDESVADDLDDWYLNLMQVRSLIGEEV